jgi:hypothetical protein
VRLLYGKGVGSQPTPFVFFLWLCEFAVMVSFIIFAAIDKYKLWLTEV